MTLTFKEIELLTKDRDSGRILIMSYFERFPNMVYDVKNNGNYKLLPDILRRVKQRNAIASGQFIFDTYDVKKW